MLLERYFFLFVLYLIFFAIVILANIFSLVILGVIYLLEYLPPFQRKISLLVGRIFSKGQRFCSAVAKTFRLPLVLTRYKSE